VPVVIEQVHEVRPPLCSHSTGCSVFPAIGKLNSELETVSPHGRDTTGLAVKLSTTTTRNKAHPQIIIGSTFNVEHMQAQAPRRWSYITQLLALTDKIRNELNFSIAYIRKLMHVTLTRYQVDFWFTVTSSLPAWLTL
jgi:hypothetical protein